jgi:ribosomal protein L31
VFSLRRILRRPVTADAISTDVCFNCHPAYTGRERAVANGGRIARCNRRRALAAV